MTDREQDLEKQVVAMRKIVEISKECANWSGRCDFSNSHNIALNKLKETDLQNKVLVDRELIIAYDNALHCHRFHPRPRECMCTPHKGQIFVDEWKKSEESKQLLGEL